MSEPIPHGTRMGYNRHRCRCQPCRDAAARYERGRQWDLLNGRPRRVDKTGTQRRLQALYALGWDWHSQARYLNGSPEMTRQWAYIKKYVYATTARRVAAMYDELSMRLPPTDTRAQRDAVTRARNRAAKYGWAPPLAWNDEEIDDPDARPYDYTPPKQTKPTRKRRADVDENVVLAVLAGERRDTTPAEKQEIGRRWREMGRPMAELARVTGWKKPERYGRSAA